MIKLLFYPKDVSGHQMIAEVSLDSGQVARSGLDHDEYVTVALDVLSPSFAELWNCETRGVVLPHSATL